MSPPIPQQVIPPQPPRPDLRQFNTTLEPGRIASRATLAPAIALPDQTTRQHTPQIREIRTHIRGSNPIRRPALCIPGT
ncbi:hypothetical protein A0H81_11297 [Grifola frondosa]|uniref:Uncharacterized protein n=1 Tax=Grifola frondosa TaxID=5627 RepID=A0A1C7M1Q2_GRIFR|nr:hypothetical protein A0H81_11297 [Grifola frondosa]